MTLITDEYRKLNAKLHRDNDAYGRSGHARRDMVRELSHWGRKAILDYGCGKCTLSESLGPSYRVTNYDPCVEPWTAPPKAHPVVVCGDVLEHVEPDCLEDVLKDLQRLTEEVALLIISIVPSSKFLADGRNAHLIVKSPDWWREQIELAGFEIEQQKPAANTIQSTWFIARPL